jgi:transposase
MKNQSPQMNIGIDIAKGKLDAYILERNEFRTFDNDKNGIKKLIQWVKKYHPTLILCEATGGYQDQLIIALLDQDLPAKAANPARIRHYALSCGILAKTDKIDARTIARFAAERKLEPQKKQSKTLLALNELLAARRFFVEEKKRLTVKQEHCTLKIVLSQMNGEIKQLTKRIKNIENEIFRLIESDNELKEKFDLLKTMPGIGNIVAATLIIECPELEEGQPEKICALAGVVPMNCDSGKMRGRRKIQGGRKNIRNTLFTAAMAGVNRVKENNIFKQLYNRLLEKGKTKMIALIAVAHKILRVAHFILKNKTPWINNLKQIELNTPPLT